MHLNSQTLHFDKAPTCCSWFVTYASLINLLYGTLDVSNPNYYFSQNALKIIVVKLNLGHWNIYWCLKWWFTLVSMICCKISSKWNALNTFWRLTLGENSPNRGRCWNSYVILNYSSRFDEIGIWYDFPRSRKSVRLQSKVTGVLKHIVYIS